MFPYADGMLFQNAVFHKLGQESFAEVFRHPPTSTQQIIHPERYLEHFQPQIPDPPEVPAARKFRKLAEGTLGELDYRILLTQYAGKEAGESMAAHLAGSSYELLEHKNGGWPALAYASALGLARIGYESFSSCMSRCCAENGKRWRSTPRLTPGRRTGRRRRIFGSGPQGAAVNHLEGWQSSLH